MKQQQNAAYDLAIAKLRAEYDMCERGGGGGMLPPTEEPDGYDPTAGPMPPGDEGP